MKEISLGTTVSPTDRVAVVDNSPSRIPPRREEARSWHDPDPPDLG